jgi:lactoylglutathione lyase
VTVATSTEANVEQAVPFFGVHDIETSLRFYTDGLGFRKTIQWTPEGKLRWCWLELGNVAVMLQEFWKSGPDSNAPTGKLGAGMSICFTCRDAIALYKEFVSRDIRATKPFVGNGMWVTQVTDPDGYELYFESPTDAPEESEYSGS